MKKDKTRQLYNTYTGKEKIELYNRYYGKIYLEPISEDSYQLIGPENIYTFMRVGFKDLGKARTDYTNIELQIQMVVHIFQLEVLQVLIMKL